MPRIESTLRRGRNPQYLYDAAGRPVFLTGSHTWNNLIDIGPKGATVPFNWGDYLDFLEEHGHNFIRLWAYPSLATWNSNDEIQASPWLRTGPGTALDGLPKFDLARLDDTYFTRMRERVQSASDRGIYIAVMFFEGNCALPTSTIPIRYHMFAAANNINGIDIEARLTWVSLQDPAVLDLQKAYIRKVVETVGDLDNVLYEICNEAGSQSYPWQEYLTQYVRSLEAGRDKQHLIGQTGGFRTSNQAAHEGSADWISPGVEGAHENAFGYRNGQYTFGQGPFDRGDRPVILDTDHLWGIGGNTAWAWKSFCRGYNLLYMDRWDDKPSGFYVHPNFPRTADESLRRELGAIRSMAERLDLSEAHPLNEVASSGYCLAVRGHQYVAFAPEDAVIALELPVGDWRVTWRDTTHGTESSGQPFVVAFPGTAELVGPHKGPGAVFVEAAS